jgi:hypothetical protein
MIESRSYYEPELRGRFEFSRLVCDRCEATYPKDGLFGDGAALEAHVWEGWDVCDGRDLCPGCQAERAIHMAGFA